MDSIECTTHSFIIKIWLEEGVAQGGEARWRGRITHVGSGAQGHFQDMQQMQRFVRAYLRDTHALTGLGLKSRLRRWLGRLRRS